MGALGQIDIGGEFKQPSRFDTIRAYLYSSRENRRPAMSMKPQPVPGIPEETARVVRAIFPKGNFYTDLRDSLGAIYHDELFADLYSGRGQPAYAPWRLALVTLFQFRENLTDRQAADAVRSRLDWKYALSLELTDPGFDHTVLSEFRTRLVALSAEERFLEAVIDLCKERGWLKARGRQRTDSTHVLAKVRALNRTECVVETLRHALNVLAVVAPEWLRSQVQPEWLERYGARESRVSLPLCDRQTPAVRASGRSRWMGIAGSHQSGSLKSLDAFYPSDRYLAARLEAGLLASRRRWNLDCRAGPVRGGEVVLFPL